MPIMCNVIMRSTLIHSQIQALIPIDLLSEVIHIFNLFKFGVATSLRS